MKSVIWFTCLSGSGKTTLSKKLFTYLKAIGKSVILLDGDELRSGLSKDLDFSNNARTENIRRVAELAGLLIKQLDIVIVATISPAEEQRRLAKEIIGLEFKLIYLSTSLQICIERDPKGHYLKARQGLIENFTGISAQYEIPTNWDLELNTSEDNLETCFKKILNLLNF